MDYAPENTVIYNVYMESCYEWRLVVCSKNGLADDTARLAADFDDGVIPEYEELKYLESTPLTVAETNPDGDLHDVAEMVWDYFLRLDNRFDSDEIVCVEKAKEEA